jgi:Histidine kinase-, DNA gyrase B-, and HSP90-like ATPase
MFDADSIPLGAILEDGSSNPHLMKLYTLPSSPTASGRQSRYGSGSGSGTAGGSETLLTALVDVDRRRIANVLRNLLSNALNFTPSGGDVTVSVRLSSRMGPKTHAYPRPYFKGGLSRNISRSSSSVFGSRSSPNDDPTTVVNTLSNSERGVFIPADILSFKNCAIGADFVPKPDDSPDLLSDRPDIPDFNSASISPRRRDGIRPGPTRSTSANIGCNRQKKEYSECATPHSPMRSDTPIDKSTPHWPFWSNKIGKISAHGKPLGRTKKKNPCYLIVEVTDTGTGIARENVDRIFKEIVQFNPNELHGGGHGGSGLGMVLSKGIVEAHGGKMWLTSEGLGKGSTFGFGLPLSKTQTHPEHRGRQDTSTPIIRTTHGSGSVGDSIVGSASVDAQTRSFHSSVVAALSELDVVPRPYGIPDSTTPPRTILRQSSLSTIRNDIMKVASFKDPILEGSARTGEIVLKRGTMDRYHPPDPLQTAFVTLSPTPEDYRISHDDCDLTPRNSIGLLPPESLSNSSVADFIPQTLADERDIPVLPRPYQKEPMMTRRRSHSHSAEPTRTEPRHQTSSTTKPRHALIVEVRTVQYSTVQYSTVQYMVQSNIVQHSTV